MRLNVEASLGHDPNLDIGGTKVQLQYRNAGKKNVSNHKIKEIDIL